MSLVIFTSVMCGVVWLKYFGRISCAFVMFSVWFRSCASAYSIWFLMSFILSICALAYMTSAVLISSVGMCPIPVIMHCCCILNNSVSLL